jgi:hypothetical protein
MCDHGVTVRATSEAKLQFRSPERELGFKKRAPCRPPVTIRLPQVRGLAQISAYRAAPVAADGLIGVPLPRQPKPLRCVKAYRAAPGSPPLGPLSIWLQK